MRNACTLIAIAVIGTVGEASPANGATANSGAKSADVTLAGADLSIEGDLGKLLGEADAFGDAIGPILSINGVLRRYIRRISRWGRVVEDVAKTQAGADLRRGTVRGQAWIHFDEAGGVVWSARLQSVFPKNMPVELPATSGGARLQSRRIQGRDTFYDSDADMSWSVFDDALWIGNRRGLQRLLAASDGQGSGTDSEGTALQRATARRALNSEGGELAMVLVVSKRALRAMGRWLGADLIAALGWAESIGVVFSKDEVAVRARARNQKTQKAMVAALSGVGQTLAGLAGLSMGVATLDGAYRAAGSAHAPWQVGIGSNQLQTLADSALGGFTLQTQAHERGAADVEARYQPSSMASMGAAALLWAGFALRGTSLGDDDNSAEALLSTLQRAERAHKARTGEYLACGPVPAKIPTRPVPWPKSECLSRLGLQGTGTTRYQVSAKTPRGNLALVARGDTDDDGVPEVWFLDAEGSHARQLTDAEGDMR